MYKIYMENAQYQIKFENTIISEAFEVKTGL